MPTEPHQSLPIVVSIPEASWGASRSSYRNCGGAAGRQLRAVG